MKLKHLALGLTAVGVVLVFALVVALRLPLVSVLSLPEQDVQLTDLDRSTLLHGRVYVDFPSRPNLAQVRADWRWCPGPRLLAWCLQLQSSDLDLDGQFSLGLGSARLDQTQLRLGSLRALGFDPALASLQADVWIEQLLVEDLRCPLASIRELTASGELSAITVLGAELGQGALIATASDGWLEAVLTGDHLSGRLGSQDMRSYSGRLVLVPPEQYRDLLNQYGMLGANGEYEQRVRGAWSCDWS